MTCAGRLNGVGDGVHLNALHHRGSAARPSDADRCRRERAVSQRARSVTTNVNRWTKFNGTVGGEGKVIDQHGRNVLADKKPLTRDLRIGNREIVGIPCIHDQRKAVAHHRLNKGGGSGYGGDTDAGVHQTQPVNVHRTCKGLEANASLFHR